MGVAHGLRLIEERAPDWKWYLAHQWPGECGQSAAQSTVLEGAAGHGRCRAFAVRGEGGVRHRKSGSRWTAPPRTFRIVKDDEAAPAAVLLCSAVQPERRSGQKIAAGRGTNCAARPFIR